MSDLNERELGSWFSGFSPLARFRPLLAGLDGAALAGATAAELGQLGVAAIHARKLCSAPSRRSLAPSAPAAAVVVSPEAVIVAVTAVEKWPVVALASGPLFGRIWPNLALTRSTVDEKRR